MQDLAKYIDVLGVQKGLLATPKTGKGAAAHSLVLKYQSTNLAELLQSHGFQVRQGCCVPSFAGCCSQYLSSKTE